MEIHSLNMCYFIFILKILLTLLYAMKTIQKYGAYYHSQKFMYLA